MSATAVAGHGTDRHGQRRSGRRRSSDPQETRGLTAPGVVPLRGASMVMLVITAAAGVLAFAWPLLMRPDAVLSGSSLSSSSLAPIVLGAILPLVLALVLIQISNGQLDVKALAMLGVLTALGAFARPLGAGTAGVETVFFLVILAGRVFGPGFGFVLGNTTLFASALITGGVGPWLPYQMLGAGFIGLGSGLLPRRPRGAAEIVLLAVHGAVWSFVYGIAMDFSFWPFAVGGGGAGFDPAVGPLENLHRFFVVNLVTGMGWNTGRAITNVVLIGTLGSPVLRVLRRAAHRAAFD